MSFHHLENVNLNKGKVILTHVIAHPRCRPVLPPLHPLPTYQIGLNWLIHGSIFIVINLHVFLNQDLGCQNKIFRVELVAFHFYDASLIYRAKRFQANINM